MFDTVCVFNNKVFVLDPDISLVSFDYQNCDNDSQTFKQSSRFKIPLSNEFRVKSLFLDVVENYSVGLKCLILLAVSAANDLSTFIYSGTFKNRIFRLRNSGWLRKTSIEPNKNLFITHGPTLIYFLGNALEIYSLLHNTKQHLELKTVFSSNDYSFKVLQATAIGQLQCGDINVILLILHCETRTGREVFVLSLRINTKLDIAPAIHNKLSTSIFFPRCFQNVLKSISVTNVRINKNSSSNITDVNWKDNFCCLATHKDCLVFNNGVLKYVARLPFSDIFHIKTEFCDFKLGNVKLILMSKKEDVHLFSKADSLDAFDLQLSKTWPSIKSVLCGDFLMNGSIHLLLLNDTAVDSWQDDCILTDISSSNPVDILRQTMDSDSSMSRAIPGLLAKVQKGKLSLVEAESKISRKIEATLDALFRLNDYSNADELVDHHVSSFQESLMDIILHNDENCRLKKNATTNATNLRVQNHWSRYIDNRCVFCWTFSNADERIIFNPTLMIVIQNQPIQCAQKVFVHNFGTFRIEDECRRQINPGERFSVVASSEVPEFHCKCIEVSAILSWYDGTSLEFENELYLPMGEKALVQCQLNLETVVSASDIFRTQLKDISSSEHLACMKVIQQRIVLSVLSLHSNVTEFENLLLTSAHGAAHLCLLETLNQKYLVFKSANLSLYGAHMILNVLNSNTLEIEAFTKNDKETYQLVQFLYQYLPEDVLILPHGTTLSELDQLKHRALSAIKDEIDLLLSTFAIHNVVEMVGENNSKVLNEAGTIVIPKETFLRIRKTLVKKECTTDNIIQDLSCAHFSNERL